MVRQRAGLQKDGESGFQHLECMEVMAGRYNIPMVVMNMPTLEVM